MFTYTYNGYTAKFEVDTEADVICGKVININDTITFQGKDVREAKQAFKVNIDQYVEFCKSQGRKPNKPFSGKLPFRTTPTLHQAISIAAQTVDKSINSWMEEALQKATEQVTKPKNSSIAILPKKNTPIEEYEHEQRLIRLEEGLDQLRDRLRDAIKSCLEGDETDILARCMAAVQPFLNQELKELMESIKPRKVEVLPPDYTEKDRKSAVSNQTHSKTISGRFRRPSR